MGFLMIIVILMLHQCFRTPAGGIKGEAGCLLLGRYTVSIIPDDHPSPGSMAGCFGEH